MASPYRVYGSSRGQRVGAVDDEVEDGEEGDEHDVSGGEGDAVEEEVEQQPHERHA